MDGDSRCDYIQCRKDNSNGTEYVQKSPGIVYDSIIVFQPQLQIEAWVMHECMILVHKDVTIAFFQKMIKVQKVENVFNKWK